MPPGLARRRDRDRAHVTRGRSARAGSGRRRDRRGKAPLVDRLRELRAPLQLWYGADDAFIRPDEHGRIAVALGTAGKRYSLGVFPGATHGCFGEDRPSYAAGPARIAWRDTLAFQGDYLVR